MSKRPTFYINRNAKVNQAKIYSCRLCCDGEKLATAVEALELTIDTLDHLQYCLYESADTRFTQNRLATARAALEKVK